ncbi:MAG: 5'/3'-nucleotidase SurE [Pirellulales bacterium]
MSKPLRFLLTNDDGVDAPGLASLAAVARELGEAYIVAPHIELSGCSHRVTVDRPLTLQELDARTFRLDGTPADCVRVALGHMRLEVDYVLSGINPGGNLGADVWMSGTVAAVREAALWKVPGIAISQYRRSREPVDWRRAANWTREVLAELFEQMQPREPEQACRSWNVNLPDPPAADVSPTPARECCAIDANRLDVRFEASGDQLRYRGRYQDRPRTQGSDVERCFAGAIAVSQLTL